MRSNKHINIYVNKDVNKCREMNVIGLERRLKWELVAPNCSAGECAAVQDRACDTQRLSHRATSTIIGHSSETETSEDNVLSKVRRLPSSGSASAPEVRSRNLERPHHFHRVRTIGRKQYWLSAALAAAAGSHRCVHKLPPLVASRPTTTSLISSDLSFFRTGDALRMDVVEKKTPVSEIAIVCGAERGVFELKRFGPGGASRCIRSAS